VANSFPDSTNPPASPASIGTDRQSLIERPAPKPGPGATYFIRLYKGVGSSRKEVVVPANAILGRNDTELDAAAAEVAGPEQAADAESSSSRGWGADDTRSRA
jgi:hypothetical protein